MPLTVLAVQISVVTREEDHRVSELSRSLQCRKDRTDPFGIEVGQFLQLSFVIVLDLVEVDEWELAHPPRFVGHIGLVYGRHAQPRPVVEVLRVRGRRVGEVRYGRAGLGEARGFLAGAHEIGAPLGCPHRGRYPEGRSITVPSTLAWLEVSVSL